MLKCCLLYCTVNVLYILGLENASGRRTSNPFTPSLRCCAARPTTCSLYSSTTSSFSLRELQVVLLSSTTVLYAAYCIVLQILCAYNISRSSWYVYYLKLNSKNIKEL